MNSYSETNERYAKWLQGIAGGTAGMVIVALWSFAEATFWFIAPDFLLILFCAFLPTAWKKLSLAALAGSLLGGMVSFGLNTAFPEAMTGILNATPFVTPRMLAEIGALYSEHSYKAVLYQSFSFMQFKIWTNLAVQQGFNPLLYFPLVMLSRAIRLGGVSLVAHWVGRLLPKLFAKHGVLITVLHTLLFLGMLIRLEGQ